MNEKRKNIMGLILVLVYMILTVSGLTLIKVGGNSGTIQLNEGNIGVTVNWISAIGLICYLCSFLLFTKIVIMYDLSYILPLVTGIVQILTLISAFVIFKEEITKQGIIGACVVIIGIIIMNYKKV